MGLESYTQFDRIGLEVYGGQYVNDGTGFQYEVFAGVSATYQVTDRITAGLRYNGLFDPGGNGLEWSYMEVNGSYALTDAITLDAQIGNIHRDRTVNADFQSYGFGVTYNFGGSAPLFGERHYQALFPSF